MNECQPPWNTYQMKFRREWVCIKCGKIVTMKLPACPKCGEYLCVRIVKIRG
ncbi:zinc ribbon-containing protein [Candidatus Bathyarchaeota archaeon]|nr:zinc ribbon-containing protein [Candidatus Bathyarchaeota archaeon]